MRNRGKEQRGRERETVFKTPIGMTGTPQRGQTKRFDAKTLRCGLYVQKTRAGCPRGNEQSALEPLTASVGHVPLEIDGLKLLTGFFLVILKEGNLTT